MQTVLASPIKIRLFGPLTVEANGRQIAQFQTRKTGGLLAYLAYYLDRTHSRDTILELTWPEGELDSQRACLCTALNSLRRQLEPPGTPRGAILMASRTDIRLNPQVVSTDVAEFQSLVRLGDSQSSSDRIGVLERAIDLYRGELLAGCCLDWVLTERAGLAVIYLQLVQELLHRLEKQGQTERALRYALGAVAAVEDREQPYHDAIRLLRATGRDNDALQLYKQFDKWSRLNFGCEAPAETTKLVEDLLRRKRGARVATRPISTGWSVPRVEPESAGDAPQETTPAASLQAPLLPLTITRLFGREQELERLVAILSATSAKHLRSSREHIVTLVGWPGCGKTRLAIEAARLLTDSLHGAVYFVALADCADPEMVADEVLRAVGSKGAAKVSALDQVAALLTGKPSLIIFDNAEHLSKACRTVIEYVLSRVPEASFLVTSRVPLGMDGERRINLHPLPIPDIEDSALELTRNSSVQLFIDRAQSVRSDFQVTDRNAPTVASICRHLEGIPLAIELAATRVSALSALQIEEQLKQPLQFLVARYGTKHARHATLEVAIAGSFEPLPAQAKEDFCHLSLFRAGWDLDAAKAVCGDHVLESLEQLIEHSLIQANTVDDSMRFRMLESLREFGKAKVGKSTRELLLKKHADHFVQMAARLDSDLNGANVQSAVHALEQDHDNLRLALKNLIQAGKGARLAGRIWRYWYDRGLFNEGRKWLESALDTDTGEDHHSLIRTHIGKAVLAHHQGAIEAAFQSADYAERLARPLGDPALHAESLNNLGLVHQLRGDTDRAETCFEESLRLYRQEQNCHGSAGVLMNLGTLRRQLGKLVDAAELYEESRRFYAELGDLSRLSAALSNLGALYQQLEDLVSARVAYEQGLEIARKTGNCRNTAVILYNLGDTLVAQGNRNAALPHLRESIRLRSSLSDFAGLSLPLMTLARLRLGMGEAYRAASLLSASAALRKHFGDPYYARVGADFDELEADLRNSMRTDDFQAAWALGSQMSVQDATEFALRDDTPIAPMSTAAFVPRMGLEADRARSQGLAAIR